MKKLLLILLMAGSAWATTFTEWYVRPDGSNLNAGSTTNAAAVYTGVGDSDGTSVFTPSDGSTPASTVSATMWGSVYVTSGATVAVYVGMITNVAAGVNGAVTFTQVAKAGTFPAASGGAHTITLKVGGAWVGPAAAVGFPFNFATATLTNGPMIFPRVNMNGLTPYWVSAGLTHSLTGPIRIQGYTNTPGDLGKWDLRNTNVATSTLMVTLSGANIDFLDAIISNSGGNAGQQDGISTTGTKNVLRRVVVHDIRGNGINLSANGNTAVECEAYACNGANTVGIAGINLFGNGNVAIRCISHDNTTARASGFQLAGAGDICISCIADSNTTNGFYISSSVIGALMNCDAYNNGGHGVEISSATACGVVIENCNFIKNTYVGIVCTGTTNKNGSIVNCGFGAGTQANGAGATRDLGAINEFGSLTYAANVTPWTDPANGDFRINLTAAKSAGWGNFTETAASYAGTVAYPDIGAAQSVSTNAAAAGGTVGYGFAQ